MLRIPAHGSVPCAGPGPGVFWPASPFFFYIFFFFFSSFFFFFGGRIAVEVCVVCVCVMLLLFLVPFILLVCACWALCWLACEGAIPDFRARFVADVVCAVALWQCLFGPVIALSSFFVRVSSM